MKLDFFIRIPMYSKVPNKRGGGGGGGERLLIFRFFSDPPPQSLLGPPPPPPPPPFINFQGKLIFNLKLHDVFVMYFFVILENLFG